MDTLLGNMTLLYVLSFGLGTGIILLLELVIRQLRRAQAKAEVAEIIADAQESANEKEQEAKARAEAYADQMLDKAEAENKKVEDRIEDLEAQVAKREDELENKLASVQKKASAQQSRVDVFENQVNQMEAKVVSRKNKYIQIRDEFINKLEAKLETPRADFAKEIQEKYLAEVKTELVRELQSADEDLATHAEVEAKKLITMAINRFARPYCPERGIGYLNFENEEQKNRVLGPEQSHLREVEKLCGVDLNYDEPNQAVNVYGFDPVRRELGRATVERMMRERTLNISRIAQLVEQAKKELFQRITNDGNKIAKELRLLNLSPEIKNMMGALRYRYSFTQNQYFHCAEVGHLAGLLAAELDVQLADARRAATLHDIGKSMDHSVDGGHAMIGADFIKQHGEQDHIVHAVRAHHFDEQPETNLAYVVIAADAISGARPGARRSTVATYTQKIQDLQTIARSFEGVMDTHVLSAGREIRVYVDGQKLDDLKSLELSKLIAHKIEDEMQYPGQIRVTVVRETHAVEMAR